jgi:hypothetical protein
MYANQAILVRVTPSRQVDGQYQLRVSGPTYSTSPAAPYLGFMTAPFELYPSGDNVAPRALAAAIYGDSNSASQYLERLLLENPYAFIFLDLRAMELYSAPWEAITTMPPFNVGPDWRPLIRYSPRLADLALTPLSMPVDALVAELNPWPVSYGEPAPRALRHFRAVSTTRLGGGRFRALLRSASYDLIHLRARAVRDDEGAALDAGTTLLRAPELRHLLASRERAVRLVILETDTDSMPPMLEIAHRIIGRSGPTVLVAETGHFDFDNFYYDITHDTWLSQAFANRRSDTWLSHAFEWRRSDAIGALYPAVYPAALLMARGGHELLRLSQAKLAMTNRTHIELLRVGMAIEAIRERQNIARDRDELTQISDRLNTLRVASQKIEAIHNLVDTYDHYEQESKGMEPMTTAAGDLNRVVASLGTYEAPAERVVNTWFEREDEPVPPDRSLASGGTYRLNVMVGPPSRRSNIQQPVAIPDEQLTEHYTDDRLPVRVVLFSTDFRLIDTETVLTLPRPPAASETVVLNVIAPSSLGQARLRVGLYYQNNLLQSIMITAAITTAEVDRHATGNVGEVEWALSGSLRDIDRFEEKAVSFLANETPDGTHVIAAVGTGFRRQFEFDATELHVKIDEARRTLQWVCGDPAKKEKYRFEPANRGSKTPFREHLSGLADFGYDLYNELLNHQNEEFEAQLEKALMKPTTLQAAAMKSMRYVFPWALVYDQPVIPRYTNEVCPDFMNALDGGATADQLADHHCFTQGCAYRDDTNIVCPSGFWGFRHIIEQPLAIRQDAQPDDAVPLGSRNSDAVDVINASGLAQMLMGYSENLKQYDQHRQEVMALKHAKTDPYSDLIDIGQGLQRIDLHCVYFYCHGGHKRGKAWLGVGARPPDLLYPSNLRAWKVRWPTIRPFVFINGCDTVGMTPSDLLTFNEALARCKASGVIGSEITIPETLGRQFGKRFLEGLLGGKRVGDLVRRLRLELLAGYNPLGLAYTPYCLAKLRIAYQ